jgi:hypothetical protein
VSTGSETGSQDQGAGCFGADGKPNPTSSGCDVFALDVNVPAGFWDSYRGTVAITATGFAPFDVDAYVYKRNADGTVGAFVQGDGAGPGQDEHVGLTKAAGSYYVVLVPWAVPPGQSYQATARFETSPVVDPVALNQTAPPGLTNYRASHDQYTSHSEPTIAMDPLNHNHLVAGSKMYENNAAYLFKIGTYESFDGGRTWQDQGFLPGYCQEPGQCDPNDLNNYRVTSDITLSFDDEGNAYGNVLDAPGGADGTGWNMNVHVKRPGQPWTTATVVHDNRNNELTKQLFLDDKNWIAVDNRTDANGGPNQPGDRKVGTMYVCWSYDGAVAPTQQIVVMKSSDGGKTWGGFVPGDDTPRPLSQQSVISGIGCHIAIGPHGEVYATWYANLLGALMQAKSTDRGQTWTPAYPIATITGNDDPFPGEAFRNLSIPTSGVDKDGNVYVAVTAKEGDGAPVVGAAQDLGRELKNLSADEIRNRLKPGEEAGGDGAGPGHGADVILFKSADGGQHWSGPVRVNQDAPNSDADQFQPWMAITPSGQLDVSYFDRRNDPDNYFIDTWLSRSNDGGATWHDQRASRQMWDPAINPPTSPSGAFIGDYQGLVADDDVAIPFWNDTQAATLPKTDPGYSQWQEVWAARVPNCQAYGGTKASCDDPAPTTTGPKKPPKKPKR